MGCYKLEAQLINQHLFQDQSFVLENHHYENFLKVWHYHPELELVIILESTGTRFVGDCIEKFEPGEIVLIGKNLPHRWLNDKIYFDQTSGLVARAHVIHFQPKLVSRLLDIPEMSGIHALLRRAARGIKFEGYTNSCIADDVTKMFDLHGYERLIKFLNILKMLSEQERYRVLSSAGYVDNFHGKKNCKIVDIYEYVMNNFTEGVCLDQAAKIANMNSSSFSRYFKRIHKKTFTKYVNEVRIGYACKLLLEQQFNISEVCYKAGFNNVSNFNRQFKSIKKMPPSEYIDQYHATK